MRRVITAVALCAAAVAAAPAQARTWTRPHVIPDSSGAGYPYDVAVARNGATAFAFVRDGVRVVIRSPHGWWSAARTVSTGRGAVTGPRIIAGARGTFIVAWTQSRVAQGPPVGLNSVRTAIRSPSGRWGAPHTVGATQHFVEDELHLATDGRGDVMLAWRGVTGTGSAATDILQSSFRPAGGAFTRPRALGEAGFDLRLRMDGSGTAYAAWTHVSPPAYTTSSVRFATRRRHHGWSRPVTVARGDVGGPELSLTPDRRPVIAWRGAEQGIGAQRTGLITVSERGPGGVFASPLVLAGTRSPGPQLAVNRQGEVLVVFNDTAASDPEPSLPSLYWSVGSVLGTFGFAQTLPAVAQGPLAMMYNGTAVLVWGSTMIHARVRPAGGAFGADEVIAVSGGFPVLATGDHAAVAVWLSDGRLLTARRRG